jgi:hypothetical protein
LGLQWNQVLEAGGVLVGDRVDIELDMQAIKVSRAKPESKKLRRR